MEPSSQIDWPSIKDSDPLATLKQVEDHFDPSADTLHSSLKEVDRWAHHILKDAGLPTEINALQARLDTIEEGSSAWYAGNSLLQSFTLRSALESGDQATTILLGFLLADFRWQGYFAQDREQLLKDQKSVEDILSKANNNELEIETYSAAINALKKKYPHCTVNALRLLLSNKLNVSKQRLDDLDIRPE
tara:strand:+ start:1961 stop:2530 length:570 start_codon:yes stop_codon:yes gene_type:complete